MTKGETEESLCLEAISEAFFFYSPGSNTEIKMTCLCK